MLYARRGVVSRLVRLCLCRLEDILGMSSDQHLMVYDAMLMMVLGYRVVVVVVVVGVGEDLKVN